MILDRAFPGWADTADAPLPAVADQGGWYASWIDAEWNFELMPDLYPDPRR